MEEKKMLHIDRQYMRPFEMGDDNEQSLTLPCRGLKLIGVRFYQSPEGGFDGRKAKCIQKSLYGRKEWFYLNEGFVITETDEVVTEVSVSEDAFDSSRFLYSIPGLPISVNAIVGENGTGKSTIIDTIIRLLNNLSAAIIGEDYVYSSAQHLHYIDNVYASIAVYINTKIQIVTCRGRYLTVRTYEADLAELEREYDSEDEVVEHYRLANEEVVMQGNEPRNSVLPPQEDKRNVLEDWFYTLVSNYSLYAYNYRDYEYEETDAARISYFKQQNPKMGEEDKYWLKGVFHKNDGYQTPVVIHPMREDGYVKASKVNLLGKQNLVSLSFEARELLREDGTVDHYAFPFREINKTHYVVGLLFPSTDYDMEKSFEEQWIKNRFDVDDEMSERLSSLEWPIKEFWADSMDLDSHEAVGSRIHKKAWDYLAFKTIKVLWTYKHYETVWNRTITQFDEQQFKEDMKDLMKDSSHRTLKIRQTLVYLRFRNEPDYYLNLGTSVDVDRIWEWMTTKTDRALYPNADYHQLDKEDLLPPPFVDTVLRLVDKEHYEAYKRGEADNEIIPFGGLSAGERQIAYTIGNIIYHLRNIESGKQDMNANHDHLSAIKYNYVNIMLDEVELYFHPDLQRRFMSLLVGSIQGLRMPSCLGINITLVTHSPFVLSDIPTSNILYMSRGGESKLREKTFASNIHDLFNDAFFLPCTLGEIAQEKVGMVVGFYELMKSVREDRGRWNLADDTPQWRQNENLSQMMYVASIVGDQYLYDELNDMLSEAKEWLVERVEQQHEEN